MKENECQKNQPWPSHIAMGREFAGAKEWGHISPQAGLGVSRVTVMSDHSHLGSSDNLR